MEVPLVTASNIETYNQPGAVISWSRDSGFYPIERELVKLYFPPPPARILDLGCGAGRTTIELAQMGYCVAAIDLATELLLVARARVSKALISRMNGTQLGFRDQSFDACLFSFNGIDCTYPSNERRRLLMEVKRTLRPGGKFYFSSHNVFGQFGRNGLNGLRGSRANLLFLKEQAKNQALREGYWAFKDATGVQLLYATSPQAQMRELVEMGFNMHCVRGLKRYKDDISVSFNNGGESSLINETIRGSSSDQVNMWKLKWFYPHIQYVASV
jgi:SAM-dependent methyltransferase